MVPAYRKMFHGYLIINDWICDASDLPKRETLPFRRWVSDGSAKERSRLAVANRHVVFELDAIGEFICYGLNIDTKNLKS